MKLIFLNKKLHILFINSWYPSKVMPTNGDFIQRHAEAVAIKNKVTAIHIVSDKNNKSAIDITDEDINNVRTIIAYVKFTKNPLLKWLLFTKAFKKIHRQIKTYDVIHLNRIYPLGIFALYLKYSLKKPFIISEHWTDYKYPLSKKIGRVEKQLSKVISKNAAFVCPVTDDLKESMQLFGLNGNYKKIPNVVNTSIFTPQQKTSHDFTLIHISNMINEYKNITGILEVFKQINDRHPAIKLKLIGDNTQRYNQHIKELKLSTDQYEILNHMPQQELANHLKNSDVLILFSNYENLPCVILEAFSCGIPVISTNVGGIKENFPENFGALISAKNQEQLFDEIDKFYTHKYDISDKNAMHKYIVQNFSKEHLCDEFTKLYHKSLNP